MSIKIIEYNVLHGFHTEDKTKPFKLETERLKAAQKVIQEEKPKILVLTEACFGEKYKENPVLDYQKLFNFPHHAHVRYGGEWGISVLSRFPLSQVEDHSIERRPHIRAHLDIRGRDITLDVVHPHPEISELERKKFIHSILQGRPDKNYLLVGDFNALSPDDIYDREKLIRGYQRFVKGEGLAEKIIDDLLTCQTIREVKAAGLIDTGALFKNPELEMPVLLLVLF